ncbi:carbohydrate ABC transporter permease [Dactylosporangium sp. CS-033363]|uniref:carbohydrate ABC transporter permease n=1 Tax=Dactylosporangium sp. CS-033363 TaxID=3239935 RepID=UPI003D8D02B8
MKAAARAVLALVAVLFLLPFGWLLIASIQPGAALSAHIDWHFTTRNFADVLNADTVFIPMLNSLIISGGTALLTVVAAVLAAYPLSRHRSRSGRALMYTILFSTCLPITAVMVPVYTLYSRFELTDSVPALILFMTASSLPFGIWMMKNFMDGVPVELEEAAWTDGAGWAQSLYRIVLPLMIPGLTVVFVFTFVLQWGNFFVPFILLQAPESQPASVTIYTFFSTYGQVAYGQLAAFAILYTAPVVLMYSVLSRVFGGAFSLTGAVKG